MTSQGGNNKETERARVVHLSHVLWDNVVLPWLCPPPDYGDVAPIVLVSTDTPAAPKPIMAVLRAGEALFPLLALCCSAVTSAVARSCASSPSPPLLPSHHDVIRWCAVSRCPRSAEWILSHNRGGDGGDAATRNRMRMSIDVLTGLCWGGHIDDARSFVEKGRAWGSVRWPVPSATTTNAAPSTNSGMPQLPAVQDYCSSSSSGSSVDACTGASKISTLVGYPKELASSSEEVRLVIEEFWSESGIIRLIEGVCKGGHLEVLKWVVSSFPIGSDLWCRGALHSAIYGCHIDIIRWLTHNFPVYERDWQSLPVMKTKHVGVQAIKKLAEEFPLWVLSSTSFCSAAAGCKGSPTDEVLSVCNWFKDTFSPQDDAFLPPPGRSTIDPEIIKWIASDGNEDVIWAAWTYCYNWGIDLVKWFIEEKSVQPTENHFMLLCRNSEDNLSLVELLYQTLFPEGGTDTLSSSTLLLSIQEAIASLNEKIADWLIELYVNTHGSKPLVSRQAVYESHRYGQHLKKSRGYTIRPDCVAWLLDKYSGKCDVKFSEQDAAESHCKLQTNIHLHLTLLKRIPVKRKWYVSVLHHLIKSGTLSQAKELVSLTTFTQYEVAMALTTNTPFSSKVVKWLVLEFSLTSSHVNESASAALLFGLVLSNKRGCAEWAIHKFPTTLSSVLTQARSLPYYSGQYASAATWKCLLDMFPPASYTESVIDSLTSLTDSSVLRSMHTADRLTQVLVQRQPPGSTL